MTFRSVIIKGFAGVFCLAGLAPGDFYRSFSLSLSLSLSLSRDVEADRAFDWSFRRAIDRRYESRLRGILPSYLLYVGFLRLRRAFDTVSPLSIDAVAIGIYLKKEGEISPELINQTDGRFIRPVNNSGRYRGRV